MYEPWPGSVLSTAPSSSDGLSVLTFDKPVIWLLLASLSIVLVFFRTTVSGLYNSTGLLASENRAKEILLSASAKTSIFVLFLESIPFLAYEVVFSGITEFSYWSVLAIVIAYFIFRHVVFRTIGWLTAKNEGYGQVEKLSFAITALLSFILCVPVALPLTGINVSEELFGIIAAVMVSLGFLAYFIRGYQIINQSGSSLISWILYLCTLEILPLCVVVTVVVS